MTGGFAEHPTGKGSMISCNRFLAGSLSILALLLLAGSPPEEVCDAADQNGDGLVTREDRETFKAKMEIFKRCMGEQVPANRDCVAADLDHDGVVTRADRKLIRPLEKTIRRCAANPHLSSGSREPSLLLVGLDSAGWAYLDTLMDHDYLPLIKEVSESGARATMVCSDANPNFQCYCPQVWGAMITGYPAVPTSRSQKHHGMIDFHIPASQRQVAALWEVLNVQKQDSALSIAWHNTATHEFSLASVITDPGVVSISTHLYDSYYGSVAQGEMPITPDQVKPDGVLEGIGMLPPTFEKKPLWFPLAEDQGSMEALLRMILNPQAAPSVRMTLVTLRSTDRVSHNLWGWVQHPGPGDPFLLQTIIEMGNAWNGVVYEPEDGIDPSTGAPYAWYDFYLGKGLGRSNPVAVYQDIDLWLQKVIYWGSYDYVGFASDHAMTRNFDPILSGHHGHPNHAESRLGIFSMAGPGLKAGEQVAPISILDAAPTLAYILGLEVAEDLPGRVVIEMFEPDWLAAHPIETVPTWDDHIQRASPSVAVVSPLLDAAPSAVQVRRPDAN